MKRWWILMAVAVVLIVLLARTMPVAAYEETTTQEGVSVEGEDTPTECEIEATQVGTYDDSIWIPDAVKEYAAEYDTITVVDLTNQHAYCCVGGEVIADADCVSGDAYKSPTPTGLYKIWYMVRGLDMMGIYHTEYAAFFDGDIALHDADAWRSEYGGTIYQGSGSHGCVNLPRWFAQIVYENSWIGTPVYVF